MKLPRWLLTVAIALTILLPLVMVGWWWTQWPQQTAVEFGEVLSDGEYKSIQRLMPDAEWLTSQRAFQDLYHGSRDVTFLPRSVSELILGRLRFRVGGIPGHFLAERSRVSISDRDRFLSLLHKQGNLAAVAQMIELLGREMDNFKKDAALEPRAKDEFDRTMREVDRQVASRESLKDRLEQEFAELLKNDEASR